jgi:hypothetical protein
MSANLERKLRELIDKQEIQEVLVRYCRGFDRADAELLRTVYHPGAIDDRFPKDSQGHPQTVPDPGAYLAERSRSRNPLVSCHRVSTITIELDGDVAQTESYYDVVMVRSDNGEAMVARADGRYIDRFERRNGEWRIVRRIIATEWSDTHRMPAPRERSDNLARQSREDISYQHLPGID